MGVVQLPAKISSWMKGTAQSHPPPVTTLQRKGMQYIIISAFWTQKGASTPVICTRSPL